MEQYALAVGKTFVWHETYGASVQATIDFDSQALGWTSEEMPMGEMGTYTILKNNGRGVAGALGTATDERLKDVPPHWAIYIAVDDVDAKAQKCVSLGATVLVPAFDVPNVGRMSLIQDPQGVTFWLFKDAMS
jgi:predicted enzyme related to lactoylglutathione lyase